MAQLAADVDLGLRYGAIGTIVLMAVIADMILFGHQNSYWSIARGLFVSCLATAGGFRLLGKSLEDLPMDSYMASMGGLCAVTLAGAFNLLPRFGTSYPILGAATYFIALPMVGAVAGPVLLTLGQHCLGISAKDQPRTRNV